MSDKVSFLSRVFLILIFSIFPKVIFAQAQFTQTSLTPIVLQLDALVPYIATIYPDPDSSVLDSMMIYSPLAFGDSSGNSCGDGPLIPYSVVRRNTNIDTFSVTTAINQPGDANITITEAPLGEGGFVTLIGQECDGASPNPSQLGLAFGALSTSAFNFPIGTSILSPQIPDAANFFDFTTAYGCDPIAPSTAILKNFKSGSLFPTLPLFNKFFTSGPFPMVTDPQATILTGSVNGNIPKGESAYTSPDNDDQLAFFGISVEGPGPVQEIPLTTFFDLGGPTLSSDSTGCSPPSTPVWPEGPLAATRPLLADFNGDQKTDLVILVDVNQLAYSEYKPPATPPPVPQDFIARFEGDGTGGLTHITPDIPLGNNRVVFDIAAGDFDGNGTKELFVTYPFAGPNLIDPPKLQIIQDVLGDSPTLVDGPALPDGTRPLFADAGNCGSSDGGITQIDDIFLTGVIATFDSTTQNFTSVNPSDVICLLGAQSVGATVYPASKMVPDVPPNLASHALTLPISTAVGKIGCDTGWTGVNVLGLVDDKGDLGLSFPQALIAERLDCNPYFKFITGGGCPPTPAPAPGICLQGSGCGISNPESTPGHHGMTLYWALLLIPLMGYVTYVLIWLRKDLKS